VGFQAIWKIWEVPRPIVDVGNLSCVKKVHGFIQKVGGGGGGSMQWRI
jgi:hypothetical protein